MLNIIILWGFAAFSVVKNSPASGIVILFLLGLQLQVIIIFIIN